MKTKTLIRIMAIVLAVTVITNINMEKVNAEIQSDVVINKINFPDDNFRGYVYKFDVDEDGILSIQEIGNVDEIDVSDFNVSSLEGIQIFTSMTVLNCSFNSIAELDLTGMTKLSELYCQGNGMKDLNLENCGGLTILSCWDNAITKLSLVDLTKLTEIYCYENELNSLDISKLNALKILDCHANKLTTLDVSGLTLLEEVGCSKNYFLKEITFENNTALSRLICSESSLENLDVSACVSLDLLDCTYNNLINLDVSKCNNLEDLSCYGNDRVVKLTNGQIDFTTLGDIDVTKISNVSGGTISGNILVVDDNEAIVTYCYDCGNNFNETFNLTIDYDESIYITQDDWKYQLFWYNGLEIPYVSILSYTGTKENVTIPRTVTYEGVEYKVDFVGGETFSDLPNLKSVDTNGHIIREDSLPLCKDCPALERIFIRGITKSEKSTTFSGGTLVEGTLDNKLTIATYPGAAWIEWDENYDSIEVTIEEYCDSFGYNCEIVTPVISDMDIRFDSVDTSNILDGTTDRISLFYLVDGIDLYAYEEDEVVWESNIPASVSFEGNAVSFHTGTTKSTEITLTAKVNLYGKDYTVQKVVTVVPEAQQHTYDSRWTIDQQPTCTQPGSKSHHCTEEGCTSKIDITEIPMLEHTCTEKITPATFKSKGSVLKQCSVCGTVESNQTINYISSVKLSKTSYIYNGKKQKPKVIVKDSQGNLIASSNYTVKYASGCKSVGKYTVKVIFKGQYSGEQSMEYLINPKASSITKIVAKKKGFTVKWKKVASQTTGYQIQYSTKKNFRGAKSVNISKNKTVSKTISKLKAKKKYYVRIRTYKTVKVNGKKVNLYSNWSKVKTIKTK